MGLFDKLKSAANFLTGNTVEMNVELPTVTRGVPFTVKVTAKVKDKDVSVKRVYFKIHAYEKVKKENIVKTEREFGSEHRTVISTQDEIQENQTFNFAVDFAGEQLLKAMESYSWQKEITLPENVVPTISNPIHSHYWTCLAGLDTKGNDPDTGWKVLMVL